MDLTLEQAAERTKMHPDELIRFIENDELVATQTPEDTQYLVTLEDLEAFLNKKSFDAFWNNTDVTQNEAVEASPQMHSRNLRRVLTAEAVADLKIEHKVLTSRVETLERLFSEFMELEKEEKALVLDDAWKIHPSVSPTKPEPEMQGEEQSFDLNAQTVVSNDHVLAKEANNEKVTEVTDEVSTSTPDDRKGELLSPELNKDDQSFPQSLSAKNKSKDAASQSLASEASEASEASQPASIKPKSAKELLTGKVMEAMEERQMVEESQHHQTVDTKTQASVELDSPIAQKLANYERRLAEAKQTATKIWH